jgi:hypothetical protein
MCDTYEAAGVYWRISYVSVLTTLKIQSAMKDAANNSQLLLLNPNSALHFYNRSYACRQQQIPNNTVNNPNSTNSNSNSVYRLLFRSQQIPGIIISVYGSFVIIMMMMIIIRIA